MPNIVTKVKILALRTIDIILPPKCVLTGQRVDKIGTISHGYWQNISFIDEPYCDICSVPFDFHLDLTGDPTICGNCLSTPPTFDKLRTAIIYDENSKSMVLAFKYADKLVLKNIFSNWIIRAGNDLLNDSDIIAPVPLHRKRLWQRRYNQSAILAKEVAKNFTNLKYCPQLLKRIKTTPPQRGLSKQERINNVKNTIKVKEKYLNDISGKNICIVDDVYTSGATINECAKILKKAGAKNIYALTLARVVL